jgi:hypothetical protein
MKIADLVKATRLYALTALILCGVEEERAGNFRSPFDGAQGDRKTFGAQRFIRSC